MAISQQDAQGIQDKTQALEAAADDLLASGSISAPAEAYARAAREVLKSFHRLAEKTFEADGGDVTTLSGGSKTDP